MTANKLIYDINGFNAQKCLVRLEKATRKWPITYSDTLIHNLIQVNQSF